MKIDDTMLPFDKQLDTSHLLCPLPLLKAKQALNTLRPGEVLQVISTDPAAEADFKAFAKQTGNTLLDTTVFEGKYLFWLKKKLDSP